MQVAYQKSQASMISLILGGSLLVIAATNNATPKGTASPTLSESTAAALRAEAAAERAEAAASRAEEAAKRAEAATKLMLTQPADAARHGDSTLASNSKDTADSPEDEEDEDLRCVRFMAGKKYADFNVVEREARVWLAKHGHAPPKGLAAVFEVADETEFVTVKFGQRVGERYWYVKFNHDLEVEEWGTRMLTAKD